MNSSVRYTRDSYDRAPGVNDRSARPRTFQTSNIQTTDSSLLKLAAPILSGPSRRLPGLLRPILDPAFSTVIHTQSLRRCSSDDSLQTYAVSRFVAPSGNGWIPAWPGAPVIALDLMQEVLDQPPMLPLGCGANKLCISTMHPLPLAVEYHSARVWALALCRHRPKRRVSIGPR
ncbi:hypothetical protein FKP32DRAFT_572784 [Trametes sanguinea]|nr:hypothetical protein FKP32DRAFT_572784 [Trametes sanguinea]